MDLTSMLVNICNFKCGGDPRDYCGGSLSSYSVYETGYDPNDNLITTQSSFNYSARTSEYTFTYSNTTSNWILNSTSNWILNSTESYKSTNKVNQTNNSNNSSTFHITL